MRILMIAPTNTPHGVRPARSLLQKGYSVCLFGYHSKDPLLGEQWPNYTYVPDPTGGSPQTVKDIKKIATVLQHIYQAFQPDLIHIHWISWHLQICASLGMRPLVVSIWGSDLNNTLSLNDSGEYTWRDDLPCAARSLAVADYLIVDDPTMLGKCAFAADKVPTRILPLGADEVFFAVDDESSTRIRRRLSLTQKYIFTAPRLLNPIYRTPDILRAFALVAKEMDAVLILKKFLVREQSSVVMLQQLAKILGIEKQVRFYNIFSPADLRDLYAVSSALINFPARDAFPVTFAEAAACGARVITCWHPAYDVPLVKNFFTILPDDSVASLAQAIQHCIANPFAGNENRVAEQELARREYSHETYIRELISIYFSLVGKEE